MNNSTMWLGHPDLTSAKCEGMEMSVLEIQRAILKLQQQQQQQFGAYDGCYLNDFNTSELTDILARPEVMDYGYGWPEHDGFVRSGVTSATTSCCNTNIESCSAGVEHSSRPCPPSVLAAAAANQEDRPPPINPEKLGVSVESSFKKRKTLLRPPKPEQGHDGVGGTRKSKKIKAGNYEEKTKTNVNEKKNKINIESSTDEKENSELAQKKTEYIHVRARRGQATDSHSLAERVRRERISERMKYLQDLVPGCSKITGKAGMLDEIINYVQSLQRQIEFLSMKLASVSTTLDLNTVVHDLLAKQGYPAICSSNYHQSSSEMTHNNSNSIQYDQTQQFSGTLEVVDAGIRPTISAPVSYPSDTYLNSSSSSSTLTLQQDQMQSCYLQWDNNNTTHLQDIYSSMLFHHQQQQQLRGGQHPPPLLQSQPLVSDTGSLKMEMM